MSLETVCRICLRYNETMCSLFNEKMTEFKFKPVIGSVLEMGMQISLSNDAGLPSQICMECREEIRRMYEFKLKCIKSESILKKLKNVQVKVKHLHIKCKYDSDENFESLNQADTMSSSIQNEMFGCNDTENHFKVKEELETLTERRVTIVRYGPIEDNEGNSGQDQCVYDIVTSDDDKISQDTLMLDNEFQDTDRNSPSGTMNYVNMENIIKQDIKEEPELEISVEGEVDVSMEEVDFNKDKSEHPVCSNGEKCPGCSLEGFDPKVRSKQLQQYHIEGKLCKLCKKEFEEGIAQHNDQQSSSDNAETFLCSICSKKFSCASEYNGHKKTHDNMPHRAKTHATVLTNRNDVHCTADLFQCKLCSASFRYLYYLSKHQCSQKVTRKCPY